MIRSIYPQMGEEIADLAAYLFRDRRQADGRPWLMVNMVNSVDGATTVEGGATGLTDADDQALFHAFRAVADVILVGASTVRAEDYGPPTLKDANLAARRESGRGEPPRLAVISRSLDLDPDSRLFSDGSRRPLLITCATAPSDRVEQLAGLAELVVAGEDRVELGVALPMLGDRGHRVVLCEGGPTLNGQLVAADVIDEINLSTSPRLVAGQSARIVRSPEPLADPHSYVLDRMLMGERTVFARWIRDRRG